MALRKLPQPSSNYFLDKSKNVEKQLLKVFHTMGENTTLKIKVWQNARYISKVNGHDKRYGKK